MVGVIFSGLVEEMFADIYSDVRFVVAELTDETAISASNVGNA